VTRWRYRKGSIDLQPVAEFPPTQTDKPVPYRIVPTKAPKKGDKRACP